MAPEENTRARNWTGMQEGCTFLRRVRAALGRVRYGYLSPEGVSLLSCLHIETYRRAYASLRPGPRERGRPCARFENSLVQVWGEEGLTQPPPNKKRRSGALSRVPGLRAPPLDCPTSRPWAPSDSGDNATDEPLAVEPWEPRPSEDVRNPRRGIAGCLARRRRQGTAWMAGALVAFFTLCFASCSADHRCHRGRGREFPLPIILRVRRDEMRLDRCSPLNVSPQRTPV